MMNGWFLRFFFVFCVIFCGRLQAFNVSIEQAVLQTDPTRNSLIVYEVVFASAVTGGSFDCGDVNISGSATASCFLVSEQAPMDGTRYQVVVNGLLDGTINAAIVAGTVASGGLTNNASTSSDANITLDTTPPVLAATLSSPSNIGNNLNAALAGSCGADAANGRVIAETATGAGFTPYPAVSALDASGEFSIAVVWQEGDFSPKISCFDALDNGPTITIASNFPAVIKLDVTRPDITIDHVGSDPTQDSVILFKAIASEAVAAGSFTCADIDLSASTVTSVSCTSITFVAVPLGVSFYEIAVNAVGSGEVTATISENSFTDLATNGNNASTSTDNTVSFFDLSPEVIINAGDAQVLSGTYKDVLSIVVKDSNGNVFCTAVLTVGGWGCTPAAGQVPGDGETITATGSDMFGGTVDGTLVVNGLATVPDKDMDGIPDRVELYSDSDGDGVDDYLDIDSDNDGIPDVVEAGDTADEDGDKISNRFDVDFTEKFDSNGDGIDDAALFDQDNDNIPDFRDKDSDNDGLPDASEAGLTFNDADGDDVDDAFDVNQTAGVDVNGDGIDDNVKAKDTDGRKLPDYYTVDSDDDGISDAIESNITLSLMDTDNDGIDDAIDADVDGNGLDAGKIDSDGDGVDDVVNVDTDGDSVLDRHDLDSDNDSVLDAAEAVVMDANNDGFIDDGDSLVISPLNSDADALPDFRDTDKENDTVLDISQTRFAATDIDGDGRAELSADVDKDGIMDSIDNQPTVYGNLLLTPTNPVPPGVTDKDSDGDLIPDSVERALAGAGAFNAWLSVDADMDGIGDLVESGLQAAHQDTDGDGIDDAFDSDADGDGNLDSGNKDVDGNQVIDGLALRIRNTDGDGVVDMLDTDSDADGLSDKDEGRFDFDKDGIEDYIDLDEPVQAANKGGAAVSLWFFIPLLMLGLRRRYMVSACLCMASLFTGHLSASPLTECLAVNEISILAGKSRLAPKSSGVFVPSTSSDTGVKVQLACQPYKNIFAEFFYTQLGSVELSHLNPALNLTSELDYQAIGLSGRYRHGYIDDRLGLYGRLGLAVLDVSAQSIVRVKAKGSPQLMVGAGVDWVLNNKWSIDLAYDRYTDDAQLLMLGLSYQLGRERKLPKRHRPVLETVEGSQEVAVVPQYSFPDIEVVFDESVEWKKPSESALAAVDEAEATGPSIEDIRAVFADSPFVPLARNEVAVDSCDKYKARGMDPSLIIGFALDSSGMNYQSMQSLQHFSGCLSHHLDGTLIIEGHTDDTASERYNLTLSRKRAATVKHFLLSVGMRAKRITDIGIGEEALKNNKQTELGQAQNRRVELYIR